MSIADLTSKERIHMHATLRADAHVAAGRLWPPGPRSDAHLNLLEVAMPPVLAAAAPERGLLGRRRLDERVRDRIVAETQGNPLALLELARGVTPEELAGGFVSPRAPGPSSRIEESFRRRLTPLPSATRLLLLVAAAEPLCDPVLVWRAANQLGIKVEAR